MDKEYLKRVLTYVIISAVAIGIMIYVGYHMVKGFTSEVEAEPTYLDTFDEVASFDAYILRRERVVRTDADGIVNYLVRDGEKVAIGDRLADICRSGSTGIRERITEIDEQIKALDAIETGAAHSSTSDAVNIEAGIRELLYSVTYSAAGDDIGKAVSLAGEMKAELDRHAIVTGKTEGFAERIAELRAERASLSAQLTDVAKTVTSGDSAYFYYDVDGYESAFSFDDVDELTLDDIYAMTEASQVTPGSDAIGKLVLDYAWYIVVPTDRAATVYFTEGQEYDINFSAAGKKLPMELHSILSETSDEGRAALIFECSELPDDFGFTRMQPVTVTVRSYTGYRVPLSAVRVVNYDGVDVTGVYILYGSVVYFRRVEIVLSQDGYALCDSEAGVPEAGDDYDPFAGQETQPPEETTPADNIPYLSLYDMVITSARGLYDGKIVAG